LWLCTSVMWWDFINDDWRAVYNHWAGQWWRLDSGPSCLWRHWLCSELLHRVSVFNMTTSHSLGTRCGLAAAVLPCWGPLGPGPITGSLGPSLTTWPLQNIWFHLINIHSNVANGISVSSKCIKLFEVGLSPDPAWRFTALPWSAFGDRSFAFWARSGLTSGRLMEGFCLGTNYVAPSLLLFCGH